MSISVKKYCCHVEVNIRAFFNSRFYVHNHIMNLPTSRSNQVLSTNIKDKYLLVIRENILYRHLESYHFYFNKISNEDRLQKHGGSVWLLRIYSHTSLSNRIKLFGISHLNDAIVHFPRSYLLMYIYTILISGTQYFYFVIDSLKTKYDANITNFSFNWFIFYIGTIFQWSS